MRLLLDTAVLIFAVESPERLSKRATVLLEDPQNILEFSTVSIAEIAIKSTLGKLNISVDLVRQALGDLDVRVLPFAAEHSFQLFELPLHHGDPFDRQIIAQALAEEVAVVTPDATFGLYQGLKVVWK